MADNVTLNTMSGGDVVAADDAGAGGKVQIVKLAISTDGSATAIPADAANGIDVDVTRLPALPAGTNNIGDVDVLSLPALPAGTNNIGDVDIASIAAGDNNIGNVDVVTLPALPAGTNNIGDVDVLSIIPGTAATNLGKAIDTALGATDTGVLAMRVRDDALATLTEVDNDVTVARVNARGATWVALDSTAAQTVTLAAGTATNEVVGDVAQDAAVAGNPVLTGGRASTATPSAMSGDGDSVYVWLDRSGATVATGYVAADAAVAGNPILNGARASTAVPTAMSADGDAVHIWADLNGALVVRPRLKQLDIAVTPTISTAVYASADLLGSVMTFAGAALVSGGTGTITKAILHDEAASNFEIWLHLFKVSPSMVNADNGVFDITDANLITAIYVATIKFLTTDTKSFSTSSRVCEGTWLGGPPAISYETSGSSSLFGVLEARGAYDAAATDDLIVTLSVIRD